MAVAGTSNPGYVYTSSSGGSSWNLTTVSRGPWSAVVSSQSGSTIAAVQYGGYIYTATNSTLVTPSPQPLLQYCSSTNRSLNKKSVFLYIIFPLGFMGIGILVYLIRRNNTKLIMFSPFLMAVEMGILGLDVISDITYIVTLYEFYDFVDISILLLVVRIIHPFSNFYILNCIMGSGKSNKYYSELIDIEDLARNAKLYGMLFFTSILEITSIKFLPWLTSEFSKASGGYPDLFLFRLCGYSKMTQSLLSALTQVLVLIRLNHSTLTGSCAIILTVTFISTALVVFITVFEVVIQATNKGIKDNVIPKPSSINRIEHEVINPL